ncbi:flagellar biosynthetic protein FliR [Thermovibrio sp.]
MSGLFDYISSHYWGFLFVFIRLSAFFMAFPFFSTPFVPATVRVVLLLAFSFFFSSLAPLNFPPPASTVEFALLALKEFLIGFFLALIGSIFYAVVVYAAELISYMMGLTIANLFDPTFGMVSIVGRLFAFTFYAVFFATGGEELFVGALYQSFKLIPPGNIGVGSSLFHFLVQESALIFTFGFKLAFPFIFALFITNLALALVNRLIPQINVFIVGLPLQIFVGLLTLAFGFSVVVYFTVDLVQRYLEDLFKLLEVLRGG